MILKPNITKREYFAGLAMQAMLSSDQYSDTKQDTLAEWSVTQADSLIAALDTIEDPREVKYPEDNPRRGSFDPGEQENG